MPSHRRRYVLKSIGAAGAIGLAGCSGDGNGNGGNGNGNGNGGTPGSTDTPGGGDDTRRVGVTQHAVGGSWITAFFDAGRVYAESQGYEFESFLHNEDAQEQITQIRQMINQDYDGIVAVPYDESVDTALEEAEAENIPVFSANNTIESEHIKTFTAFGNYNAGEQCGDAMVDELDNQKGDMDQWDVLNVRGEFTFQSNQRTDGFLEAVESHDKTNVVDTVETDWSQADSQQKTLEWLNANDAPDGVYASNMTCGLGVLSALEEQDLVVPKGEEDHIVHTQLDGGPDVNPRVGDGEIDLAVDQPVYYYIPLAMKQLADWWEDGDDSLPEPGTELTEDDYSFEPATYMQGAQETELFTEPIWAPAQVQEANGHINVQTAGLTITEDNYDEPYHWGNIWG